MHYFVVGLYFWHKVSSLHTNLFSIAKTFTNERLVYILFLLLLSVAFGTNSSLLVIAVVVTLGMTLYTNSLFTAPGLNLVHFSF